MPFGIMSTLMNFPVKSPRLETAGEEGLISTKHAGECVARDASRDVSSSPLPFSDGLQLDGRVSCVTLP